MERKLIAIFSADVQGYSRLMGDNEEATVRTLTAYREVMTGFIQEHRGRVVDSPGDNILAEFPSVVNAVQGALAIQHELAARNQALSAHRKMVFRIGINLGDVLSDGERIYGDGVNITARIEALTEGGGVSLSGPAYDQIKNKLKLDYAFMGEHAVKNIQDPVRVYSVRPRSDSSTPAESPEASPAPQVSQPTPQPAAPVISVSPTSRQSTRGKRLAWVVGLVLVVAGAAFFYLRKETSYDLAELTRVPYQALAGGDLTQAESAFQRLKKWANNEVKSQALAGLAAVAYAHGDQQHALEWAEQAEQFDPQVVYSQVIRGHILFDQGAIKDATQSYRLATEKTHGVLWQQAVAYNRLGRIYATRGFAGTALQYYDHAFEQHPNKAVVYANKAHLLVEMGRLQAGLDLYRQALQMQPHDPLTMTLMQEAERQHWLAQNDGERIRLQQWAAERLQASQQGQPTAVRNGWTSPPLTMAFGEVQAHGLFARRAGEDEFLLLQVAQALQKSGRISVVERQRLHILLQEMELSLSRAAEPETALQVGTLLEAQLVVTGSLFRTATRDTLHLQVFDTTTHTVRARAEASWSPGVFDGVVEQLVQDLLPQVRQAYPLQGHISHLTPQNVLMLDIGAEAGMTPGVTMLVFGPDGLVGRVEITMVEPQYSQAKILQQLIRFQEGWKVQEVS